MKTADTIVINGKIWTGTAKGHFVEAFSARDGVITETGTNNDIIKSADRKAEVIDAERKLVVPGFTDSHVHFMLGGFSLLEADLRSASSRG